MELYSKAYDLFNMLYKENDVFKQIIDDGLESGKIRFFSEEEWGKIEDQNFIPIVKEVPNFIDLFKLGYNIGNCVGTCRQLSYSYDDVDIVSGLLPLLKGTINAEKEGGHCWLETDEYIIDTSLMLIIEKSLREKFGYIVEQRITSDDLKKSPMYQARKEYTNDPNIGVYKKK